MAPVEHINGKMAPADYHVSNSLDPDSEPAASFWYGYRKQTSPGVSRYAIRSKRRNLTSNPYTDDESDNRDLFRQSCNVVYSNMQNGMRRLLCTADFNRQSDYVSLYGFAIAKTRENGGVWPRRWRGLI